VHVCFSLVFGNSRTQDADFKQKPVLIHLCLQPRNRVGIQSARLIGKIAQQLVHDAGFDPVVVGSLAQTRQFDLGQSLATGQLTAAEYRKKMGG